MELSRTTNRLPAATAAEFDSLADDYYDETKSGLGTFGKYRDTAFLYKARMLQDILKAEPASILDYGCGVGLNTPYLHECFPNAKLYGCDVSGDSIAIAKQNYPYGDFSSITAIGDLQKYKNIDCVFISTVLHHIPQKEHEYWMKGLYDILAEKGSMVVFEHNMKNPLTKANVKKSKIDENATMLNAHYCKRILLNHFYETKTADKETMLKRDTVKLRYTYFFPWRNKLCTFIERLLFWLPLGAQYCVFAKK
jgi:trans-aconitate methyltransferase